MSHACHIVRTGKINHKIIDILRISFQSLYYLAVLLLTAES